jgi:apolipoprotein D and lipocalin family protein
VQSNNFTTLFVLSREREVEDSVLDVSFLCLLRNWRGTNADFPQAWIARAGLLGSKLDDVIKNDQTGCLF